jgi:RNA polymerase sigma-70 factor (ECF subfamily)
VEGSARLEHFEITVLVHLDAAYNLARWVLNDEAAAEDAVQDACVRALRFFDTISGPSTKAWFMAVVRNCCTDVLRQRLRGGRQDEYDEDLHGGVDGTATATPEGIALRADEVRSVREAIATLPREYREVIVLRELEELSYKEISAIVQVPIGTVMSRLARGRKLLGERLAPEWRRARS